MKHTIHLPRVILAVTFFFLLFVAAMSEGSEISESDRHKEALLSGNAGSWTSVDSNTGRWLEGLWGSSKTDIFIVGDNGTILHYDGNGWTLMDSGTSDYLSDVWGSSASDVYAVGDAGTILHYDGNRWSRMPGGTKKWLFGIWGTSASDIFAVGENGTILHYDGDRWTPMKSDATELLLSIWGSSGSDVYVVGSIGTILHYDGNQWTTMDRETAEWLFSVWGSSASDIFAVGGNGTILHYNGKRWIPMPGGASNGLSSIWGSSASDVFAVGEKGTFLHYDGNKWTPISSGTSKDLNGIWGSSDEDIYIIGDSGTILHSAPPSPGRLGFSQPRYKVNEGDARAVVTATRTNGWNGTVTVNYSTSDGSAAGGSDYTRVSGILTFLDGEMEKTFEVPIIDDDLPEMNETVILTLTHPNGGATLDEKSSSMFIIADNDGKDWIPSNSNIPYSLRQVWGSSDTEVFAIGDNGTITHYDGGAWTIMNSATSKGLWGVWGSSETDVFAVGDNGAVLHYDGSTWTTTNSATTQGLKGVWGSSPTDVFAVGDNGAVLHYDGSTWTTMSSATREGLWGVWGSSPTDIFAVGDNGAIIHYDGTTWTAMNSATQEGLRGVWGSSPTDIFAVGDNGAIIHYDGTTWTAMNSTTTERLQAVRGNSGTRVFAVGDKGTILFYDGIDWTPMNSGTERNLTGVWNGSDGNSFVVGQSGTVLYYALPKNTPPLADAGPRQTVRTGTLVTLNGSNSADLNDGIVSYRWQQTWGTPDVTLSDPAAVKPTFKAPKVGPHGGSFVFQLTVTDEGGMEDRDTTIVNVISDKLPPVADAGQDQTVMGGMKVTLDASASNDPDNGTISYDWVQIKGTPEVILSDPIAAKPTFMAPHVKPGSASLTFGLTVTDESGLEDTDTVIVNIMSEKVPPMADAGTDQTVVEGTKVTLDGSNSINQDDRIVSYRWKQKSGPAVTLSNPTGIRCIFTAPETDPGGAKLVFSLTVTDAGGLAHSDTVVIRVKDAS